ncbi:MAG: DUF2442 domain-containing protein [Ignavibacteria bacterium]|nr:DUF2442 domain-containing protein [Ignavibacteria bacterium]
MYYLIKVIEAEYLGEYKIRLTFNNGKTKDVDLKGKLNGEVFRPLQNKNIFMQFNVDKELGTIVWPNGTDIAPYSLYDLGKPVRRRGKTLNKVNKKTKSNR